MAEAEYTPIIKPSYLRKAYPDEGFLTDAAIGLFKHHSLIELPLDVDEQIAFSIQLHRISRQSYPFYTSLPSSDTLYDIFSFLSSFRYPPSESRDNLFAKLNTIKRRGKQRLSPEEQEFDKRINPNHGKKNLELRLSAVPQDVVRQFREEFAGEFRTDIYDPITALAELLSRGFEYY